VKFVPDSPKLRIVSGHRLITPTLPVAGDTPPSTGPVVNNGIPTFSISLMATTPRPNPLLVADGRCVLQAEGPP
jgi:hypothetical protein